VKIYIYIIDVVVQLKVHIYVSRARIYDLDKGENACKILITNAF